MILTLYFFRIVLFALKNPRLQHIYNSEADDLEKSFMDLKTQCDERVFKYEVMIAFWLCLHLQRLEEARVMVEQDPELLQRVVVNLRENGKIVIQKMRAQEEKRKKKSLFNRIKRSQSANMGADSSSPGRENEVGSDSNSNDAPGKSDYKGIDKSQYINNDNEDS